MWLELQDSNTTLVLFLAFSSTLVMTLRKNSSQPEIINIWWLTAVTIVPSVVNKKMSQIVTTTLSPQFNSFKQLSHSTILNKRVEQHVSDFTSFRLQGSVGFGQYLAPLPRFIVNLVFGGEEALKKKIKREKYFQNFCKTPFYSMNSIDLKSKLTSCTQIFTNVEF